MAGVRAKERQGGLGGTRARLPSEAQGGIGIHRSRDIPQVGILTAQVQTTA